MGVSQPAASLKLGWCQVSLVATRHCHFICLMRALTGVTERAAVHGAT